MRLVKVVDSPLSDRELRGDLEESREEGKEEVIQIEFQGCYDLGKKYVEDLESLISLFVGGCGSKGIRRNFQMGTLTKGHPARKIPLKNRNGR